MNQDSRKDGVVGGALKLVGTGTAIYGAHKGLMSQTVTDYANKGKFGHSIVDAYQNNVPKTAEAVKDFAKDIVKPKSKLYDKGKEMRKATRKGAETKMQKLRNITKAGDNLKKSGVAKKLKAVTKAL